LPPSAAAVHDDHRGIVEAGVAIAAERMSEMMVDKAVAGFCGTKLPPKRVLSAVLALHAGELARGIQNIQIGKPASGPCVEAQILAKRCAGGLPTDTDFIHLGGSDFCKIEARLDGQGRETRVVLYAADAFLGDSEEQLAVSHKARRRIVHLGIVESKGDQATSASFVRQTRANLLLQ